MTFLNLTLHRAASANERDTDSPIFVNFDLVKTVKLTAERVTRLTFVDGRTLDVEEAMVDIGRLLKVEGFR